MNFLDMRTILFSYVLTDTIGVLVILVLWSQSRNRFEGTGFWVFNFVFQTAALLLIILRGSIPDWMSIVLANTLVMAGALLSYMGLERFVGKKSSQVHNYVLLTAFVCVHTYFTYVQPDLAVRNFNISIGLFFISFQCLWLLLFRVELGVRPLTFGVGLVSGAYCLISIVRMIDYFTGPRPGSDYFQAGVFETLVAVSGQILFILLTYSLVLMFNKRLLVEVKSQEEKFSKAFHSSPYAISLTRLSDGQIVEVNEGFEKVSGYNQTELLGSTTIGLKLWAKEEDRVAAVNELSKSGKVHEREFQFLKKSGEIMTGLFSAEIILINNQPVVLSSINDITDRKRTEGEREKLIRELQEALARVNQLSGLLPICASCKKIRDDNGHWKKVETYIREHSEADFSHGICPECEEKLFHAYD
jgi:PAS domain S-box-containing protein